MSSRTEQRRSTYKKGVDADDARRKRQENAVDIRKGKKEEMMSKRRREGLEQQTVEEETSVETSELATLVAMVNDADVMRQLEGVIGIRKKLSIEKNPPIAEVINTGVVSRLVQLLATVTLPKLQFEAAWALTNIASGDSSQTRFVVQSGAVPYFCQLLLSPDEEVREQAIWAIGNIAGDGSECRDELLKHNVVAGLMHVIVPTAKISLIRNGTWSLSNLCRGKPAPNFELVRPALPLLQKLLSINDTEVITDACWAASYLTDGPNEKIQAVVDAGIVPVLIQHLSNSSNTVQIPALRAVGNIVTGDESQTQVVLNQNALPKIAALLKSSRKAIRKEACWAISNVTAGNKAQIQAVVDSGIVPALVAQLEKGDFDVKREACWAISNATTGGGSTQIAHFVKHGCIKPLCDVLVSSDAKIVGVAMESIENILKSGADLADKTNSNENQYATMVEEADGVDKLEALQEHANQDIYKKAVYLIETYFGGEEVSENQNLVPQTNQNLFSFGTAGVNTSSGFAF